MMILEASPSWPSTITMTIAPPIWSNAQCSLRRTSRLSPCRSWKISAGMESYATSPSRYAYIKHSFNLFLLNNSFIIIATILNYSTSRLMSRSLVSFIWLEVSADLLSRSLFLIWIVSSASWRTAATAAVLGRVHAVAYKTGTQLVGTFPAFLRPMQTVIHNI